MKLSKPFIVSLVLLLAVSMTVTAFFAVSSPLHAFANPSLDRQETFISEVTLGNSTFRLSTDSPAIPLGENYTYLVEITPGADLISVNLHIELRHDADAEPFHYLGDAVYIERDLEYDTEEDSDGTGDNQAEPVQATEPAQPEVVHHILQPRAGTSLSAMGVTEGVYYVAVIVTATTDEGVESATLRDLLVVYNPESPELQLMPVVHLSALPLRCGEGVFAENPAGSLFEERRAALEAISTWIQTNPQTQLTLAISPLFLDELSSVAQGQAYFTAYNNGNGNGNSNGSENDNGSNGNNDSGSETNDSGEDSANDNGENNDYNNGVVRQIPADSPLAQRVTDTLESLKDAFQTGRLIITTQGYADPNPSVLRSLNLSDDIRLHYLEGLSTLEDVLGLEGSAITAPWTEHLCREYLSALEDVLPQSTVIIDSDTRGFSSQISNGQEVAPLLHIPESAAYGGGSEIIIANASLSSSMSSSNNTAQLITRLLEQRQETPFIPLLIRCYSDTAVISELLDNLDVLLRYPSWVHLTNDTTSAAAQITSLDFESFEVMDTIPSATQELSNVRSALRGLERALHEPEIEDVENLFHWQQVSLRSFAGPSIGISTIGNELLIAPPAPESTELAAQVYSYVEGWFSTLELHAQPITFSGSGGMLPVTILNSSDQSFYLDVRYIGPGRNVLIEPEHTHQLFPPGETFLEPNIELRNIISGSIDIQLWAGGHLIAEESIRVSATYADRIAIIVVVALAGTGLAFYVWRRVSSNDAQENAHEELG